MYVCIIGTGHFPWIWVFYQIKYVCSKAIHISATIECQAKHEFPCYNCYVHVTWFNLLCIWEAAGCSVIVLATGNWFTRVRTITYKASGAESLNVHIKCNESNDTKIQKLNHGLMQSENWHGRFGSKMMVMSTAKCHFCLL